MTLLEEAIRIANNYRNIIIILGCLIVFLVVVILIIWAKLGPEGRFFAKLNLWGGAGSIFMGLWPNGATQLWKVKGKGRALRFGRKGFVFIPDLLRGPDLVGDETPPKKADGSDYTEDELKELKAKAAEERGLKVDYNELIRTPAWLAGRRLFTGTMSANIAANPALMEALASAQWPGAKKLLESIQSLGPRVKEVYVVNPWPLDKLSEYVNISYTQHDIDETYDEGYVKGLSASTGYNKIFLILVFASLAVVVAVVYLMGR